MHPKSFGYNEKVFKWQLKVKENRRESAIEVFEGTNFTLEDDFGVLGLVIGTPSACDIYNESEIEKTTSLTKRF